MALMKHNRDLRQVVARYGVREMREFPELQSFVQPVTVVDDASSLTQPLVPPIGVAGGFITAGGVGNLAAVELHATAPHGTAVGIVSVDDTFLVAVRDTVVPGWINFITQTPTQVGFGQPLRNAARTGWVPTIQINATTTPNFQPGNLPFVLFLSPGQYLYVAAVTANIDRSIAIGWEEYTASDSGSRRS